MSANQNLEQQLLCTQCEIVPEAVWQISQVCGQDGYERMNTARARGWTAIPSWGLEGWGSRAWP